jgi:amino acid adenylation domain-containing protein
MTIKADSILNIQSETAVKRKDSQMIEFAAPQQHHQDVLQTSTGLEIALIGSAGRFPGAESVEAFWQNIRQGRESIRRFTDEELLAAGVSAEDLNNPNYVKAGGYLKDVEMFDAAFFGFYPREAEILDPQQRLFLECAWEALEQAGYDPETYQGLTGVFAGAGMNTYLLLNLLANQQIRNSVHGYQLTLASDKDFLATRVAYKLNLKGPALTVQTACSTSLVAVHVACQNLLNYQCDLALAGGVSIRQPLMSGYLYQEGGIASPDGHCRAFAADAQGTVGGNGVAVVALKRLTDALADGDHIYAVIKGSAINNDGAVKAGYTAPGVEGQSDVIATAQQLAGIDPETISYIEAHGTGTSLGDPIEIAALTQAFRQNTRKKSFCAIGSVKTNIGHLDAAAGVTGLIKTAMALHHREIPPSLHCDHPNPKIDFPSTPFYVKTKLSRWEPGNAPRRAAVSSFGIGGTNAHVILEEGPEVPTGDFFSEASGKQLLVLSAKTPTALESATDNLLRHLHEHPEINLADAAFTLQVGRQAFAHRRLLVCSHTTEAISALSTRDARQMLTGYCAPGAHSAFFMFTGQGAQYVNMGRGLYESQPEFREVVDHCAELLNHLLELDIRTVLYPAAENEATASELIHQTWVTQPVLFVIEYALAQWWMNRGVRPEGLIGHSIGEYVAACLAGVFSLEDALELVATRGRLMQSLPSGAMLSVGLSESDVQQFLQRHFPQEKIALAAVNAPTLCVLSGEHAVMAKVEAQLQQSEIACRRLHTSHAFHSAMMEPIMDEFTQIVSGIRLNVPAIPFISNLTGDWITAEQATDPLYWSQHLRQTVRFADGVGVLLTDPGAVLIETGPQVLSSLARQHSLWNRERSAISSLRHAQDQQDDFSFLLNAVGKTWLSGIRPDWVSLHTERRPRRVPLPTYPFERQRYWVEPQQNFNGFTETARSLSKRKDVAEWFYVPSWKRTPLTSGEATLQTKSWLVVSEEKKLTKNLIAQLEAKSQNVERVTLRNITRAPDHIVYVCAQTEENYEELLRLVQTISRFVTTQPLQLSIITNTAYEVTGDETLNPHQALAIGLSKVISQEFAHVTCRHVDVIFPDNESATEKIARQLADELLAGEPVPTAVAWRRKHRWVQTFESVRPDTNSSLNLREGGVYLITGGLGQMGLMLAQCLAERVRAKIILLSRRAFPARDAWTQWLDSHPENDSICQTIRLLRQAESGGGEVLILQADVSNEAQMNAAIEQIEARFGKVNGVFHCAGIIGEQSLRSIEEASLADAQPHFAAKVRGLEVLNRALGTQQPDFCLIQSSLSSQLGGLGFAAYAAANSFADAYVHSHNQHSETKWLTINWDGWQFARERSALRSAAGELVIQPEEGLQAFDQLPLLRDVSQVIVSTADLQARIEKLTKVPAAINEADKAEAAKNLHARPTMQTVYIAPRTIMEKAVADVWQKVLGIAEVGAEDDFFELGGHSLLATQVVSRLRDQFKVELPIRKLFEQPTVACLAALIEAQRVQAAPDADQKTPADIIRRLPRNDEITQHLPLSFAQQRLWFLDQLEPGSPLYNNPAAVRLRGDLNVPVLEQSFNEIIRRHETLRAVFREESGQPMQTILTEWQMAIPVMDLRPMADCEKEIQEFAKAEALKPFDLAQGPLIRVTLLRVADDEHIALLTMHHIISDGWSTGVLMSELATLYEAIIHKRSVSLDDLPVQYADFAVWQREYLQGETLAQQTDYWKRQLAGSSPLELPTDYPRPALQSFSGDMQHFELPVSLVEPLNALCQRENVTLYMTLLAAFNVLLHRYTHQEDICIGSPIAGRNRAEIEGLIGFFINPLVLRTDLSGNPTFRDLLQRVKEVCLGAYVHQDLPFEMIVEALQPQRDLSRTPLFQVMFVMQQDTSTQKVELPGLTLSPVDIARGTEKFDLTLSLEETPSGLRGFISYCTALFEAGTIKRMIGHLCELLQAIAADPEQTVAHLPMLTEAERLLLHQWNHAETVSDSVITVHHQIEQQTLRTPNAVAVVAGRQSLTYSELDALAGDIAQRLSSPGVVAEKIVGLCAERCPELVAALLGIFKSGSAYLPLDPAYPAERLSYLISDSAASIILTQRKFSDKFAGSKAQVIYLDDFIIQADRKRAEKLSGQQPLSSLAYVIYTSGSTGKPKGVMIEHEALAKHCQSVVQHYQLNTADRVLQFASLNFDPSLEQILPTLMAGATLILRDEEMWSPADFNQKIAEHKLTVVNVPPAYWQQWTRETVNTISPPANEQLRLVIIGGDTMLTETLRQWHKTPMNRARLLNAYGPTETTITALTFDITDASSSRIPIGRPLPGRVALVLDQQMESVPAGIPGELYLGGTGVARGYLNHSELTAEKFIRARSSESNQPSSATDTERRTPNTKLSSDDNRLYRTGDLVRWLPDGNLEFLGRADHQVKIRGMRIEPGEIEAVLTQHPTVHQAVVIAREDIPGDKRLVAYLIANEGQQVSGSEIKTFLSQQLPESLIPSVVVMMDALPLTIGGKVDRRALPAPERSATPREESYVAPRNPIEQELAQIWAELLRLERVGVEDNFFEIGGHSLLATQIASRVRQSFHVELPLRELFSSPTIAALARLVTAQQIERENSDELTALLNDLESLADDEVARLLAEE